MPKSKAITHADLAPSRRSTELGSKTGAVLAILTILCGLLCFVFCLIADVTHSQETWMSSGDEGKEEKYECNYSGSGKTPLLCSVVAFVLLAVIMVVEHVYILVAISNTPPPVLVDWDPDSPPVKSLTWQAGFFFVTTWICFAVAEILLLIGLSVESGHLRNWSRPRQSCLTIGQGLFSAAGIFALLTTCLAGGLYLTALRAQRMFQNRDDVRREVIEAAVFYASPPRSPPHHAMVTTTREDPVMREMGNEQPAFAHSLGLSKPLNWV